MTLALLHILELIRQLEECGETSSGLRWKRRSLNIFEHVMCVNAARPLHLRSSGH